MRKIGSICVLFFISLLFTSSLKAQSYKTAVGIRISSQQATVNNSITLKHFFTSDIAVEGLLSFGDPVALGILVEKHTPIGVNALTWFWGAGGYIGFSGPNNVGLQGALGLDYKLPIIPINLSMDWKPELNISKQFGFEPAAVALSARFVFK